VGFLSRHPIVDDSGSEEWVGYAQRRATVPGMGPGACLSDISVVDAILLRRVLFPHATRDGNNAQNRSGNRHRRRAMGSQHYLVLSHFLTSRGGYFSPFYTRSHTPRWECLPSEAQITPAIAPGWWTFLTFLMFYVPGC